MMTPTPFLLLTCRGGCACASVLAVVSALVDLAPFPPVVGLAATLGLLVGVQEAAPAVQALDQAGAAGRGCGRITAGGQTRATAALVGGAERRVLLTDGRERGSGRLHTGAVVERVSVGTGAHRSAGAEQAEPLALLPVARIVH